MDSPAHSVPHPQICLALKNLRVSEVTYFNTLSLHINIFVTLCLYCHLSSFLKNKDPPSFQDSFPFVLVLLVVSPSKLPRILLHQLFPLCSLCSVFPDVLIPSLFMTVFKPPNPEKSFSSHTTILSLPFASYRSD